MSATLEHHFEAGRLFLFPGGEWVIEQARALDQRVTSVFEPLGADEPRQMVIDLTEVGALDTAGAFLLAAAERRVVESGGRVAWRGILRTPDRNTRVRLFGLLVQPC